MNKYLLALLLPFSCFGQNVLDYRDFLIKYEGYKLVPYNENHGIVVGIGHSLTAHNNKIKDHYSQYEVNAFFESDLKQAIDVAQRNIFDYDHLPSNVKLVVICLIFNVGPHGFTKFRNFIGALNERDYQVAAVFLQESKWWDQVAYSKSDEFYKMILNSR